MLVPNAAACPETLALLAGCLLDFLLGDPPRWPHPVRLLGRLIAALDTPLRCLPERLGGVLLLFLVVGISAGAAASVLALAEPLHPMARFLAATLLVWWGVAARDLADHALAVLEPADRGDWAESRRRLAHIVGRDTEALPPAEVCRACVETVAENTSDGVVGPLLYAAVFGPVGLWAYKAVNTLDSSVGYRTPRDLRFGWASARADDLLNLIPARLTWLLIAVAALLRRERAAAALRLGWRDGRKHPSPNAAWAEAAMAGALGFVSAGSAPMPASDPTSRFWVIRANRSPSPLSAERSP